MQIDRATSQPLLLQPLAINEVRTKASWENIYVYGMVAAFAFAIIGSNARPDTSCVFFFSFLSFFLGVCMDVARDTHPLAQQVVNMGAVAGRKEAGREALGRFFEFVFVLKCVSFDPRPERGARCAFDLF